MGRRCFLVASIMLAGLACGQEPRGTVTGRVTQAGAPVSGATIYFEDAAAGISVMAPLSQDGSFVVKTYQGAGLPPGNYKVAVAPGGISNPEGPTPLALDVAKSSPTADIPSKYHKTATSGLTAQVQAGENPPFHFDLPK